MEKRIYINGIQTTLICGVSHTDNIEHWSVSNSSAKHLAEHLKANGMEVLSVFDKGSYGTGRVDIDRNVYHFKGDTYKINQCDDIFNFITQSNEGDFTYYYDRVVFHTKGRKFFAAYRNDISNYIEI